MVVRSGLRYVLPSAVFPFSHYYHSWNGRPRGHKEVVLAAAACRGPEPFLVNEEGAELPLGFGFSSWLRDAGCPALPFLLLCCSSLPVLRLLLLAPFCFPSSMSMVVGECVNAN